MEERDGRGGRVEEVSMWIVELWIGRGSEKKFEVSNENCFVSYVGRLNFAVLAPDLLSQLK